MAAVDDRGALPAREARRRWSVAGSEGARPEFDRQRPQDITAKQSVLGAILPSKDAIADDHLAELRQAADVVLRGFRLGTGPGLDQLQTDRI